MFLLNIKTFQPEWNDLNFKFRSIVQNFLKLKKNILLKTLLLGEVCLR